MNGQVTGSYRGTVAGLVLSWIGINSGEMTLSINLDGGGLGQAFAGILPSEPPSSDHPTWQQTALENGVYAAYVQMALVAHATGRKVQCDYIVYDKNRIYGLTLV
jgi:hypothetical protein